MISSLRRQEILDSLRRGTVPRRNLDAFAVGLDRFAPTLEDELANAARGGAGCKAVRGEYGSGKTFFARWLADRARKQGFASAEVQISETETPLYRLETIYRRSLERLATSAVQQGAFRSVVDAWLFALEQDVRAEASASEAVVEGRVAELLEQRLRQVSDRAPAFAAALRSYREAVGRGDESMAAGLIAWVAGQPNVASAVKRQAGIKGDIDHFGAASFLRGLLVILRDSGYRGLLLVLDELETVQRMRSDVREKSLNALRQLVDDIDAGQYPGLYLMVTGTPGFFGGPMGVQRLPPLAQRLHVDFSGEPRFDNPRAVQIRLASFSLEALAEVGRRVRNLYVEGSAAASRVSQLVDDDYLRRLAGAVAGELGGKVGVAPRVFLKKLVAEVLDRVEQFADFDPNRDYKLTIATNELTREERASRGGTDPDEVELRL